MWRMFAILVMSAFLLVSVGSNLLLYQQAASNKAVAESYRARLQREREELEARINELNAENERLKAAQVAGQRAPAMPPPGVAPAPPGGAGPDRSLLDRMQEQVTRIRGLNKKSDVPLRVLDRDALREYLIQTFERDYLPHERESDQKLLVTLGLLNSSENLTQMLLDLLQEQVIGTYNEDEKTMYIVGQEAVLGPQEKITFVHEFTHALQDQHHDLTRLAPKHPDNEDRSLAIHALIEGDAMLLQRLWAQENLTAEEVEQLSSGGADTSALDRAPPVVRTELLFPYLDGLNFVRQTYQRVGNYASVDDMFRNPPDSTEQVLHPEKYRAREKPVDVSMPDLAETLGEGWRRIDSNVLGELDMRILLEQHGDRVPAARAAAGWGGDRWQLLEKDDRQAVALRTAWDTENDAREFFDTYAQGLRTRFSEARQEEASAVRHALTASTMATELRRNGREVLAVLSFDRQSAESLATAVGGF
jgi:hypothetical protein